MKTLCRTEMGKSYFILHLQVSERRGLMERVEIIKRAMKTAEI
jgi:hypothetical protein